MTEGCDDLASIYVSSRGRFCRSKAAGDNEVMVPLHIQLENSTLRCVIKRLHYPLEIMLLYVRRNAAYSLSLRNLEEMMAERGVLFDHATVHRSALKMLPVLAAVLRRRKLPVGPSWRVDETYVLVGGQWKYLYRAVDKLGRTMDFLLTAHRDVAAQLSFSFARFRDRTADVARVLFGVCGAAHETAAAHRRLAELRLNAVGVVLCAHGVLVTTAEERRGIDGDPRPTTPYVQ